MVIYVTAIMPSKGYKMELTDLDKEELARLINNGMTSGRLDGDGYCISWSLTLFERIRL